MARTAYVWVGCRRLYDAIDCALQGQQEWRSEVALNANFKSEMYFGPKPRYGIEIIKESGDQFVGTTVSPSWTVQYFSDATESEYPRKFFLEVACLTKVAVSPKLKQAFRKGEADASGQVLNLVESHMQELETLLDFRLNLSKS
jgi:hypothetical protein